MHVHVSSTSISELHSEQRLPVLSLQPLLRLLHVIAAIALSHHAAACALQSVQSTCRKMQFEALLPL